MLKIQATQVYHDPLRAGINDVQELSKTHEAIARAKTEIQHRILTHYLPLYFPEIDRFRGNSRSDWFFAFLDAFPTPASITVLTKEEFVNLTIIAEAGDLRRDLDLAARQASRRQRGR